MTLSRPNSLNGVFTDGSATSITAESPTQSKSLCVRQIIVSNSDICVTPSPDHVVV